MTEIPEWQLAALEGVMQRCDALSDFSADKILTVLAQMGLTISRSEPVERKCNLITPHGPHEWDYPIERRGQAKCAGHPKPTTQIRHVKKGRRRGPSADLVIVDEVPAAFFQRETEEPITQIPSDEPACTKTEVHPPHIWEENDQTYGCRGVRDVNALPKNLSEAFELVPIDSTWMRKNMSEKQSNECRVFEVFFKKMETRNEFFVRVTDTWDNASVWPLMPFLEEWERI